MNTESRPFLQGEPTVAKKKARRSKTRKRRTRSASASQESVISFRVWKLDADLKQAIAEKRASRKQTVREFIAESIQHELPGVVRELATLGVSADGSESVTPVRLPMLESSLAALRDASQASGLDQSQLIVACLRQATRRKRRRAGS